MSRRHSLMTSRCDLNMSPFYLGLVAISLLVQFSQAAPQNRLENDAEAATDQDSGSADSLIRRRRSLGTMHPLHHKLASSSSYFVSPSDDDFYGGSAGAATGGASLNAPLGARARRVQMRRTLPFQLLPQPPAAPGYAHSRAFVDPRDSISRPRGGDANADAAEDEEEVTPTELLNLLNNLTSDLESQKHRIRFGFF